MAAEKYMPTRVGMLLLDTDNGYVWTVKSKTKLIRTSEGIDIEATLTKGAVPPDWKIIDGTKLGHFLNTYVAPSHAHDRHHLLSTPSGTP